jgi:sodium/proline symporter
MLIVIIVYLIMMVVIGAIFTKQNKDVNDFYLGGRRLGPLVTAMSAEASDMSSWLLMGLPGVAYLTGCAEAVWTALGLAIGTYFNWLIVSKRLRRYSLRADNAITIPDFFSNRYRDDSHALMAVSAIIIVVFFVPYTASGFAACGKLFSTLFDAPYMPAMIISAAIIVAYTSLGGFLAASTTDLIQSIIMTIALIVVIFFGVHSAGGLDQVTANAEKLPGYLSLTEIYDPATNSAAPYDILTIASLLAWGLGYFGMPHILLRFMGIKDESKLKLSRRIATIWVVIAMAASIFIGIIGYGMAKAGAITPAHDAGEAEKLLIKTAILLSHNGLGAVIIGGLILAGILACTMSTSDSQLLAASSGISKNLVQDCFGVKMSAKQGILLARLTVIGIALVAIFLARNPDSSVFRIVQFAWAGFGASFGPTMLIALFWKRSNRNGALCGMLAGAGMVFLWKFGISRLGGVFAIYELLPAFLVGCLVNVIVSLATAPPSDEITAEFDSLNAD